MDEDEDKHETVERETKRSQDQQKSWNWRRRKKNFRAVIKTVKRRVMMEAEREQVKAQERELKKYILTTTSITRGLAY